MAYLYQIVGYDGADRPKRETIKSGPRLVHGQIGRLSGQQRGYRDQYFFGLFVVSSGFEELLDRRSQQVDDADERVIVSVSPGPAFGGLEDAVERFEASVAVA